MIGTKTPDEVKDFSLDWFKDIGTDVIPNSGSSVWKVSPSGPIVTQSTIGTSPLQGAVAGSLTTVWLSGGVVGQVYRVDNIITTTGSRTLTKTFRLLVEGNNVL